MNKPNQRGEEKWEKELEQVYEYLIKGIDLEQQPPYFPILLKVREIIASLLQQQKKEIIERVIEIIKVELKSIRATKCRNHYIEGWNQSIAYSMGKVEFEFLDKDKVKALPEKT